MQGLLQNHSHHPLLRFFPSSLPHKSKIPSIFLSPIKHPWPLLHFSSLVHKPTLPLPIKSSTSSDEFPVDDTLSDFTPREPTKESEDAARRINWIERGWAPWEEVLSPEAYFARMSLNEGEEVPLQSPEAIEAFKLLSPKYRRKKMEESGLSPDEWYMQQFARSGEVPQPLETTWDGPLVVRHIPPRDWPPRDWEVDEEELRFIREAHKLQAVRVDLEEVESTARTDSDQMCLERWEVFLKQYKEWVAVNKDRLEEESYKFDQDYHPGRRKRGKDYKDDMLELPFIYPGQICAGKVTTLHLYQGAFVDIGCVYDGWVPMKGNDWYWIRHHIKVGMNVIVEVLRDSGRPPVPRKRPADKVEDQPLLSNHPYVDKLWQLHVAEQMILDDEEANPDKYKDKKKTESAQDTDFDEENSVQYTKAYFKKTLLPKIILKTNVKELDIDAARAERQLNNKLKKEAQDRGEEYKVTKLRRNIEMDEYDLIHWRRSFEEREALIRDISCRQALGLPVEEPGRYVEDSFFSKDRYDPTSALYRYDYWGEPKNSEKSKQERMTDAHNKSIVGKGNVWYEMSYEEAIKQRMRRETRSKGMKKEANEDEESDRDREDDDDDDDFDYSILGNYNPSNKPLVNGTESPRMSDKGMFEN
ncbi:protein PLASTID TRANSCRIPTIONALLY ACTIVE 10 isoform X2 [Magnolia sinica]|uniref:protein PLASTID TRANSCRIPTIONALLY ACTIVE 10 isoform X2 n=1 Tax=Magnolia sinica TaxID=86752 RepID=UPI00265AD996|nr:protein PLASTID TRANSCRIPTIONALLY ACTIVE 10 isoform X2 [Magnolia sinica]